MDERVERILKYAWGMFQEGYGTYDECLNDAINGEAADYEDYNALWRAVEEGEKA